MGRQANGSGGAHKYFCARPQNFAWFLGAGASAASGLPTATDIILDLKRRYYCQEENQDISRQDMQNEAVRSRIQGFMESQGFPRIMGRDEYPPYFAKIFADDKERQRSYLKGIPFRRPRHPIRGQSRIWRP